MAKRKYQIAGRVVDQKTQRGIAGIKVEAWDKDLIQDDLVGSTVSDSDGAFLIEFDESYYRELFLDADPDLYFKAFRGATLLTSTEDSVLWNVKSSLTKVVLEVEGSERREVATPRVLYGVAIHEATRSGDLNRMKATAREAEAWLEQTGNVSAALQALRGEIARYGGAANPVPPYGVAIHEAIASGDLNRMKAMATEAEAWLEQTGNVSAALQALKGEIARLS